MVWYVLVVSTETVAAPRECTAYAKSDRANEVYFRAMHLTPPGRLGAKSKAAEDCTHSKTLARSREDTVEPTGFGVRAVLCRFSSGEGGVKCIALMYFNIRLQLRIDLNAIESQGIR